MPSDPSLRIADMTRRRVLQTLATWAATAGAGAGAHGSEVDADADKIAKLGLDSLARLSLASLRQRDYDARFQLVASTDDGVIASYRSDGLRVYARLIVPPPALARPPAGWPVIIHTHGWVGEQGAPGYRFGQGSADSVASLLASFAQAGYLVVIPGLRGHGRFNDVPAEGLEWLKAYDNGSYLAPIFYAVDVLHALQALATLDDARPGLKIDSRRLYLTGHSQGGDAALTALAVSSSPRLPLKFAAASIWAGCFEGRIEQGQYYGAMEASAAALGDPRFLQVMPHWWKPAMYTGTIQQGQQRRQQQMYDTVRRQVSDQAEADPLRHPVDKAMAAIDAIKHPQLIGVPLQLHYSDMDHYSPPAWNERLANGVNTAGGSAELWRYAGNTHGFQVAPGWSPPGSVAGLELLGQRTLALFC